MVRLCLVNAQIKPFLSCLAGGWDSLLLTVQPFTVRGSSLPSAGIVLPGVGIEASLYLVGGLRVAHQLSLLGGRLAPLGTRLACGSCLGGGLRVPQVPAAELASGAL